MSSTATISSDEQYRYDLTRTWSPADRGITWVMLNPSTADAERDDPTIRRCIGFSQMWGYGGMTIVNLFAYRTSDPKDLLEVEDPVGPENHDMIQRHVNGSKMVVAAWGGFDRLVNVRLNQAMNVEDLCDRFDIPLRCLGRTMLGAPRHPLYVKGITPLEPFNALHGPFMEEVKDGDV